MEDSAFILKMATQMLVKMGHHVETAANGSIGLDLLTRVLGTSDDFDLVLCDFQMPVRLSPSIQYGKQICHLAALFCVFVQDMLIYS